MRAFVYVCAARTESRSHSAELCCERKWQLSPHSDEICGRDVSVSHYERLQLWDVWRDQKKKSGFCGEFCVNTVIRDARRCRLPQGMEVSLKIATVYHLQCDATVRSALGPRQVCSERRIHAHSSLVPPDDTISFVTTVKHDDPRICPDSNCKNQPRKCSAASKPKAYETRPLVDKKK